MFCLAGCRQKTRMLRKLTNYSDEYRFFLKKVKRQIESIIVFLSLSRYSTIPYRDKIVHDRSNNVIQRGFRVPTE